VAKRTKPRIWTCERDGYVVTDGVCLSCELYNAAVHAMQAAAQYIAQQKAPTATGAWLNEYGVFAWVDGKTIQLGSKEEAAPFCELTGATFRVKVFMPRHPPKGPAPMADREMTEERRNVIGVSLAHPDWSRPDRMQSIGLELLEEIDRLRAELCWAEVFAPNLSCVIHREPPRMVEETRAAARGELAALLRDSSDLRSQLAAVTAERDRMRAEGVASLHGAHCAQRLPVRRTPSEGCRRPLRPGRNPCERSRSPRSKS